MYNPEEKYKPENLAKKNCDNCESKTEYDTCGKFLDELPTKKYYVCEAWEEKEKK